MRSINHLLEHLKKSVETGEPFFPQEHDIEMLERYTNTSTDLISRADAIEAVASITMSIHLSDVICDKLLALPSADAVQGEWEFVDNEIFAGEYFCSICGKRAEVDLYGEWILSNFCPSCGARMKGGAE